MLTLYNSLSHKKETFRALEENKVRMYVCGITPYDTTHLGHAFTYIFFDALLRILRYLGNEVVYTQNVTDINDRDNDLLKRALEQNTSWQNLSEYWTQKFLANMARLSWVFPNHYLLASQQVESMVTLIEKIIAHKAGYVRNGNVFLDVKKIKDFGKLSRLSEKQMIKTAKEFEEDLNNKDKKHPLDITLWKTSKKTDLPHIPKFDSPWGKGRPGWHVECSAMALSSLTKNDGTIDIHGGGIDLVFPHHECEIAQSEAATSIKPFAKFWIHTGTVYINGKKMSKSLKNLILVDDLLKKYSPDTIRYVLLAHFYRDNWEYRENDFAKAQRLLLKMNMFLKDYSGNAEKIENKDILDSLLDDVNIPKALSIVSDLTSLKPTEETQAAIFATLKILGFQSL